MQEASVKTQRNTHGNRQTQPQGEMANGRLFLNAAIELEMGTALACRQSQFCHHLINCMNPRI